MFKAKCTQCGRSFLFDSESTGKVRCCKTPLGNAEPYSPPMPKPSTPRKDNRRSGKNKLLPCVYRGEPAGKVNCGCQGTRAVHRCTKLIRPTAAAEPAYCVMYRPVKYFGITATDGTKIDAHEIPLSEIAICQPGKCDLYEPAPNAR